jgi:hypothetical protein
MLPRHQTEFSDTDFLAEFDLSWRSLAGVKRALADSDIEAARRALVQHFRDRRTPHWIFDLRDGRRGSVAHLWPATLRCDRDAGLARAHLALANRLQLGPDMALDFGPRLDWCGEDTRSLQVPGNCFKCCHFLRDLAVAHAATRKAVYAEKFAELVARWLVDWPFELDADFTGEQMIFSQYYGEKSMPTGQRLFNWATCLYSGIAFAPQVPQSVTFGLLKAMWFASAAYAHFQRSVFGCNNHHIMRTCNVPAVMAMFFPETPRLQELLTLARTNLAEHAEHSFLSDGGYLERSSAYGAVTVEMFLAPLAIAKLNRVRLMSRSHQAIVRRAVELLGLTALPSGHLPPVGDGTPPPPERTASLLGLARVACGGEIAATIIRRLHLGRYLLPDLRPSRDEGAAALSRAARFPATGIAVIRSGWSPRATALSMTIPDAENQSVGHAHDDALSFCLEVAGRPFIWLPANELYLHVNAPQHRGQPARGYSYSSLAKNVVLVGGQPAAGPEELADAWGVPTPAVTSNLEVGPSQTVLAASYTAADGTGVSRQATFGRRRGWRLDDRVTGTGKRRHLALCHFDYGVEVSPLDDGVLAERDGVQLRIQLTTDSKMALRLRRNRKWLSPNLARRDQPYPWVLEIRFGGDGDDTLAWTFEEVRIR